MHPLRECQIVSMALLVGSPPQPVPRHIDEENESHVDRARDTPGDEGPAPLGLPPDPDGNHIPQNQRGRQTPERIFSDVPQVVRGQYGVPRTTLGDEDHGHDRQRRNPDQAASRRTRGLEKKQRPLGGEGKLGHRGDRAPHRDTAKPGVGQDQPRNIEDRQGRPECAPEYIGGAEAAAAGGGRHRWRRPGWMAPV